MFEQHPVPQQISSYQFRLVGDMTLKQFFQLAAGAVIGLIIYSLPLPGFFKWPLIVIAVTGGAAFAFLPIQDRPMEQWLVAFFRSIYAPTIFVWRKSDVPIEYFAKDTPAAVAPPIADPVPENTPHDAPTHNMEKNEKDYLSRITTMFSTQTAPVATVPAQTPPQPVSTPAAAPVQLTGTITVDQPDVNTQQPEPEQKTVSVPEQKVIEVKPQAVEKPNMDDVKPVEPTQSTPVPQTLAVSPTTTAQQAQFSPEAAPPSPPTSPNIIVGQVMDSQGKIVEGAILEIADTEGRPVRALKTNRAGHFLIVTPLPNGQYRITIEKDSLEFDPVSVKTAGEIVAPIAIRAKNALPEPEPSRASWSL